jgi:Glycosyltransferase family 87
VNNFAKSTLVLVCFAPGLLLLVGSAKRSRIELVTRLNWEYAGRILDRPFVEGYPEAAHHDPSRIEHLPVGTATAADRRLARYSDFACEYPPGALLVFSAIRLPFDEITRFLAAFQFVMGLCCVIATILAFLAIRKHNDTYFAEIACALGFTAWVALEGGFTVNEFDSCSMLAATLALLFYSRERHHGAAAALGIGGAIKLWPLLILPALALSTMGGGLRARRRLGQACTITIVGILAFAIPHVAVLMLGTSTSDLFAYATYARDRPLDILSAPGNVAVLWHMLGGTEAHMTYSYRSCGVVAPGTMLIARVFQLIFLTLYAAVLAWSASRNLTLLEFSNLCGLIVTIAIFTSKVYNANYLI